MSQLIDSMLADYSYLEAPFWGSGEIGITIDHKMIKIDWDRIEYPSGSVRHATLWFMGTFEGHLMTRADGTHDIENTMGYVVSRMDSIDRYALAAHLIKMNVKS